MKTIREWLETLPEPYRTKALGQMDHYAVNNMHSSISDALWDTFNWVTTPEVGDYWFALYNHFTTGSLLP